MPTSKLTFANLNATLNSCGNWTKYNTFQDYLQTREQQLEIFSMNVLKHLLLKRCIWEFRMIVYINFS